MLSMFSHCKVTEICAAIPRQQFSVAEYASNLLTEKEAKRMLKSTGFTSLRISDEKTTTADLCESAAGELSSLEGVDALLFVTQTPDYAIPSTVRGLQHRLGLSKDTLCFEINEGCSGYIHGLYFAASLIESKQCKKVLVLCGDTISKLTSPNDRATRCIFGDAGSATLVEERENCTMFFHMETWGSKDTTIIIENSRHRIIENPFLSGYLYLDGMSVMNFTLDEVPQHIQTLLHAANKESSQISLFACHQANKLILQSLATKLKVDVNKLPFVAEHIGNTSSASIPLLFSHNYSTEDKKKDLKDVCCCGFGVGLSAGSVLLNLSETKIHHVVEL